jgi:hypothetical protein
MRAQKKQKNGNWPSEKVQSLRVGGALSSQTYVEGRGKYQQRTKLEVGR